MMFTNEFAVKCGSAKQTKAERMNELAKAIRSGNAESFAELYELAFSTAVTIAKRNGAMQEQAEDIAQEAMMRLYRDIDKVDSVFAWVSTVVSRRMIDASRKKSNSYEVYELDAPLDNCLGDSHSKQKSEVVADLRVSVNPDAVLERAATREAVQQILALLPDQQRKVLYLYHIKRQKQNVIAGVLGISRSTVAAHIRKGEANFRREFAAHYDVSLYGVQSAYELEAA